MKRILGIGVFAAALFMAPTAHAAAIFVPTGAPITGTITILNADPTNPVFGIVPGATTGDVTESTTATPLGSAVLINPDLFGLGEFSLINSSTTEAISLDLDFATSVFDATAWFVPTTGIPVLGGTDPALIGFLLGPDLSIFSGTTPNGIPFFVDDVQVGTSFLFNLVSINGSVDLVPTEPIPEPATLGLVGTGLAVAVRRYRAKKQSRV